MKKEHLTDEASSKSIRHYNILIIFAVRENDWKNTTDQSCINISACDLNPSIHGYGSHSALRREDNCGYFKAHVLPFGLESGHSGG